VLIRREIIDIIGFVSIAGDFGEVYEKLLRMFHISRHFISHRPLFSAHQLQIKSASSTTSIVFGES